MRILRKITGKESWEVGKPEFRTEHEGFERWDDDDIPDDLIEAFKGVVMLVDIQEHDGDAPTQWAIEHDGKIVVLVDAAAMTATQRVATVPDEVREEGRDIMGEMIKDEVDETLRKLEDEQ